MNSSLAAVLFLFFFFSTNPFSLSAAAEKEPVLDTDGEELRSDRLYLVQPARTIPGSGGLGLESIFSSNIPCPKIVAQSQLPHLLPVFIHPVDSNNVTVHLSTDVNIGFPGIDAYCRSSNIWRVAPYDPFSGHWWIVNGGEIGNPGPQTLFNWFKIEKAAAGYKFTFCPSVCESCVTLCNDIGKYTYENKVLFGLTNQNGSSFVFAKATETIKQVVGKLSE